MKKKWFKKIVKWRRLPPKNDGGDMKERYLVEERKMKMGGGEILKLK